MRVYITIMVFYFFIQVILLRCFKELDTLAIARVLLTLYIILFFCTYSAKTQTVIRAVSVLTVSWIIFYVYLLGWDSGVQHFLFVLLLFSFVAPSRCEKVKISLAIFYFTIRLSLYAYTKFKDPVLSLNTTYATILQILNTLTIFTEMIFLINTFVKESEEKEQKLVASYEHIKYLASTDALTNLKNRRSMQEYLNEQIKRTSYEQKTFCIAISDIDSFKNINDYYGHATGDEILKCVSAILQNYMVHQGAVARWGGEEFLLFFNNDHVKEVQDELNQLRQEIESRTFYVNQREIKITMTFGLAQYNPSKPIDTTINNADKKLYQGKNSGRNKVIV